MCAPEESLISREGILAGSQNYSLSLALQCGRRTDEHGVSEEGYGWGRELELFSWRDNTVCELNGESKRTPSLLLIKCLLNELVLLLKH